MDFIAPMLVLITGALVIGTIFRTQIINRRRTEEAKAWAEVQSKVIDKFGNAEDVVRFLESDAARRPRETGNGIGSPHARILDAVHTGLLVFVGGIGLLFSTDFISGTAHDLASVVGILAAVIGVGFLGSALFSWALMRRWGLLGKPAANDSRDVPADQG